MAGCPTEGSRESAYLDGQKKTASAKKKERMFQAHNCDSTGPRVKAKFHDLNRSRRTRRDRFVPTATIITSGDKTPGDSLSLPTGFTVRGLPTASIVRAHAVGVCPLLSAGRVYHRQRQRSGPLGRRCALCLSQPCHSDGHFHFDNLIWWSCDKDTRT